MCSLHVMDDEEKKASLLLKGECETGILMKDMSNLNGSVNNDYRWKNYILVGDLSRCFPSINQLSQI